MNKRRVNDIFLELQMDMILSIIIPCYKVEKYIRRCLDSVLSISLPSADYEVICFDDCSPDDTSYILNDYASRFCNVKVIHASANIGHGGGEEYCFASSKWTVYLVC